ncbi:MAG: DNA alkylation repair protein [Bdellovibrionales bacterium]
MSEENPNAFKLWINADVVKKYFENTELKKNEIQKIIAQLETRELKARVQLIAHELKKTLPQDYPKALVELLKITRSQKLKSFELWPATEFIQIYGLEHVVPSLKAMYELTPRFTAEFSIRPFINKYGDEIYTHLQSWKSDSNEHIRRWLSEGTRPRLPWGERLHSAVKNPSLGLEILEHLKFDPSLYVRKSVGNHLNDIAKDHPGLVVKTLLKWKKQVPNDYKKEFQFISHRALRTLIKDGHPEALKFTGIDLEQKSLQCSEVKLNKTKFKMGDTLELQFSIKNKTKKRVKYIVDYVIYFKKSNGDLNPKVFKLKVGQLEAGVQLEIVKRHSFKLITTRKYYSGKQKVAVKVNGRELSSQEFDFKS